MTSTAGGLPRRLAHRGDWRHAPENTLGAMLAALRVPACDGLEFDVRVSKDGVPVLSHDPSLRRVQRRPGQIDELTAEELGRLGISTLAAVLETAPASAYLDVEVKGDPGPGFVSLLERYRGSGETLTNAIVSSFDTAPLKRLGRERPGWARWLNAKTLSDDVVTRARDIGCACVSVEWQAIDERAMDRAHSAGLEVAAWTVRRRSTFDRLARLGVVAVCVEAAALDG
jgi:glycerophosphoryl diester phosphodiesterase